MKNFPKTLQRGFSFFSRRREMALLAITRWILDKILSSTRARWVDKSVGKLQTPKNQMWVSIVIVVYDWHLYSALFWDNLCRKILTAIFLWIYKGNVSLGTHQNRDTTHTPCYVGTFQRLYRKEEGIHARTHEKSNIRTPLRFLTQRTGMKFKKQRLADRRRGGARTARRGESACGIWAHFGLILRNTRHNFIDSGDRERKKGEWRRKGQVTERNTGHNGA